LVSNADNELQKLIETLDSVMQARTAYERKKELQLDNLKSLLRAENTSLENKYFITNKIIEIYEYYSFEDALKYIEYNLKCAKELKNNYFIEECKLKLSKLLIYSGRYKESVDLLSEINKNALDPKLLSYYYSDYSGLYKRLSFYTSFNESRKNYQELYEIYRDSLVTTLPKNSEGILALIEKKQRDEGHLKEALITNDKRLSKLKTGSRLFALVAFERSISYMLIGDLEQQKKYLIHSAIADIKNAVKDNASMTELATILFKEGDFERAYKFINFSFEDAEKYNSPLRFVNISNILPVITKAYESSANRQKTKLKTLLIYISILAAFLLVLVFFVYKQIKKLSLTRNNLKVANNELKTLNLKLSQSNENLNALYDELSKSDKVKVNSLGVFLNLYSDYINKLELYRKMVRRHLVNNKINDLISLTKSNEIINSEIKLFNKNFDEAFLHIYPDFVEKLNLLLKDGSKVKCNLNSKELSTEIRIFALIRLGIKSSSQISKILRYSVNTIYNYRVKVKNNALDRENFESNISSIV
jgi:cell division protein FtsL